MPGPSNTKKKRKSQGKAFKKRSSAQSIVEISEAAPPSRTKPSSNNTCDDLPSPPPTPPPYNDLRPPPALDHLVKEADDPEHTNGVPQQPFIYDPGNGPRVRDTRAFLASKYFSQPPAFDIPLCAEFAQEEVLQMLLTVLPEETALILWYNKSRETSRICPACRRLYRLGDVLPDHIDSGRPCNVDAPPPPQLRHEQELSGLCSPVCFILASFNYPSVIKAAWGRTEDQMDDATWSLLNAPPVNNTQSDTGLSLGMLMRMTRLHDLGLAQLCLGLNSEDLDPEDFRHDLGGSHEVSL